MLKRSFVWLFSDGSFSASVAFVCPRLVLSYLKIEIVISHRMLKLKRTHFCCLRFKGSVSCFAGGFALAGDLAATVEASGHLTRSGQKDKKSVKNAYKRKMSASDLTV